MEKSIPGFLPGVHGVCGPADLLLNPCCSLQRRVSSSEGSENQCEHTICYFQQTWSDKVTTEYNSTINAELHEAISPDQAQPITFEDLKLNPEIIAAICEMGFASPTEVQVKAIPPALQGKDLLVQSRTGSGKTAAG